MGEEEAEMAGWDLTMNVTVGGWGAIPLRPRTKFYDRL